ncbi:hypothetical protein JKP88DRAFT_1970 [Tribonema minus]|uniref:Plastid lipid-associated protein/fibrillin conserved domain-containing protein n=1 Tax=Tribonema minus TaxID=303371 RepID=A0A835ZKP4_9STRA|nr:hypothetical protein JKP88DRAFT_1970 [Tribonema minus]
MRLSNLCVLLVAAPAVGLNTAGSFARKSVLADRSHRNGSKGGGVSMRSFFGSSATTTKVSTRQALLDAIAPLDRGRAASEEQKQEVLELFGKLEKENKEKKPLESPNVNGRWTLTYTTSQSILGLNTIRPLRSVGPIYQDIDAVNLKARNEETVKPLPFVKFTRAVNAVLEPQSASKVKVLFKQFEIGPLKVKAPASAIGFLDVTYLDPTLRLSRGDKGNIFILQKL